MLFSAHVVDTSPLKSLLRKTPRTDAVPGLRSARVGTCGPFGPSLLPRPQFGREALVACWDDEGSLDDFLANDPSGREFASGWGVRMRLFRSVGIWPGIADDMAALAADTPAPTSGPTIAITIGTFYLRSLNRFLKVNGAIEQQFLDSETAVWGTGFSNPPQRLLGTLTVWANHNDAEHYMRSSAHSAAVRAHYDPHKDPTGHTFVTGGGFFGFQPIAATGGLSGKNPIEAGVPLG